MKTALKMILPISAAVMLSACGTTPFEAPFDEGVQADRSAVYSDLDGTHISARGLGGAYSKNLTLFTYMDDVDRARMTEAMEKFADNSITIWTNEYSNTKFTFEARNWLRGEQPCRNFSIDMDSMNGQKDSYSGWACETKSGIWKVM